MRRANQRRRQPPRRKKPKKAQSKTARMTPSVRTQLEAQHRKFVEKFGREPGEGDPVFFDPDADEPRARDPEKTVREVADLMRRQGVHPSLVHAFEKTGMLVVEGHVHKWPDEEMAEHDAAIEEWFELHGEQDGEA